jgi:hypothetical protein
MTTPSVSQQIEAIHRTVSTNETRAMQSACKTLGTEQILLDESGIDGERRVEFLHCGVGFLLEACAWRVDIIQIPSLGHHSSLRPPQSFTPDMFYLLYVVVFRERV